MSLAYSRASERGLDEIEDALEPPNQIDQRTGLPFGWREDDELDGFDSMLTG